MFHVNSHDLATLEFELYLQLDVGSVMSKARNQFVTEC